jgi:hypothetical protein
MRKTNEQIAREAIASAAEGLEDSPDVFKSLVDGETVFTFNARSESGTSTFVLNPLPVVLEIVEEISQHFSTFDSKNLEKEDLILVNAVDATVWLFRTVAKQHFEDFLKQLPLLAVTAKSAFTLNSFGAKKQRDDLIEAMVKTFDDRLRKHFENKPQKRRGKKTVVGDFHVYTAVLEALWRTGKPPSEMQAARKISEMYPGRWEKESGAKSALRKWRNDRGLTWPDAVAVMEKHIREHRKDVFFNRAL